MTDPKALQILRSTHWSSAGWKKPFDVSPADFAYARRAGLMFEPVSLSHAEISAWLERSRRAVQREQVANAFTASLGSRRLELRSALGSYAIARHFRSHEFTAGGTSCAVCGAYQSGQKGYDLNVLNFERYQWGGVRHEQPEFIAFDLEQFQRAEPIEPTGQDQTILRQVIATIRESKPQERIRDLEKRLAKVVRSNKAEREILLQILAYCGILQAHERASYFTEFVPFSHRSIPAVSKIDWTYPACWWRGADGIDPAALRFYFPGLE